MKSEEENSGEEARAKKDWLFPQNFNSYMHRNIFAPTDRLHKVSMALLVAQKRWQHKLHSILVIDHLTDGLAMTWTPSGVTQVTEFIVENVNQKVMGVCISKHTGQCALTSADLKFFLETCRKLGDWTLLLVLSWATGTESQPGYMSFVLKEDKVGCSMGRKMREPADFVEPAILKHREFDIAKTEAMSSSVEEADVMSSDAFPKITQKNLNQDWATKNK